MIPIQEIKRYKKWNCIIYHTWETTWKT